MSDHPGLPFVRANNANYENLTAQCPHCHATNIFNRATDLGTFEPIARHSVICQYANCAQPFVIGGDLINLPWQMLMLDCETLKAQKRYSSCILNLAQSFEIYFSLYLRVELLYKPYALEKSHDLMRLNSLFALFLSKIEDFTFHPMCAVFIHMILRPPAPRTLSEAEVLINELPSKRRMPEDVEIKQLSDASLSELLLELKNATVPKLRNSVIHKHAHRPTLAEVERSQDETGHILYALDHRLGMLSDDLNHYVSLANGG
jgi:hypothetical protein